jgi:hypothetical protein
VESTCKTILSMTGDTDGKESVPALVTRTLKHLGLHPEEVQAAGGDAVEAQALKRLFGGLTSSPAAAQKFDVHGTRLAVYTSGAGQPPVVFISGLGDPASVWGSVIQRLEDVTTRVVRPRRVRRERRPGAP